MGWLVADMPCLRKNERRSSTRIIPNPNVQWHVAIKTRHRQVPEPFAVPYSRLIAAAGGDVLSVHLSSATFPCSVEQTYTALAS